MNERRKLIEVALPLEAINRESSREKSIRHGHPSTLHIWWARRPLAACRAVLFASLVDDPSSYTGDEIQARAERKRLFGILERLILWENSNNSRVIDEARLEIAKSIARSKGLKMSEKETPNEVNRFLLGHAPTVMDPFCGGGSIPLEAQRLGLKTLSSDLNPVAVLITKAMVEIPPRFDGNPPVNPESAKKMKTGEWAGASGLAEDVRYYGRRMREEAEKTIGHLYPRVALSEGLGAEEASVIAWLWTRTVKCPNLACGALMPLVRSFEVSKRGGKRVWIECLTDKKTKTMKFGISGGMGSPPTGTVDRRGAICIFCKSPVSFDYIRYEGKAGRIGERLMAIVAKGDRERVYLPPSSRQEQLATSEAAKDPPETSLPEKALGFRVQLYGMNKHKDLFSQRQLLAVTTFGSLVQVIRAEVLRDAISAGMANDNVPLSKGGTGALSYAEAVSVYLAFAVDRLANRATTICIWNNTGEKVEQTFGRQAIPITWDYAEANVLGESTGSWAGSLEWIPKVLETLPVSIEGIVNQTDACELLRGTSKSLVCTDPPYYDNIGYADLSDFFYVLLRRSLAQIYPDVFSTLLTPKTQELVATPHRFGEDRTRAKNFFEEGLGKAFDRIKENQDPEYPVTLFYAFKQAESERSSGEDEDSVLIASTGWETMLGGLLKAGFMITGTWPMRTERDQGLKTGANVLASSVVLVCRSRPSNASLATRREFISELKRYLPVALRKLQEGNIAPVDLAQAAIGPGISVFSRYAKVLEADGTAMNVRTALQIINQELESFLKQEEGEMDSDTQFCVAWFEQFGMSPGPFGQAEILTKAKNTSFEGLIRAGVVSSKGGKLWLVPRNEYPIEWNPIADTRLTLWECAQFLIRNYREKGEGAAADLVMQLGAGRSEDAKNLVYRLYSICERKGWADEAKAYNELVTSWSEIQKKAAGITGEGPQRMLDVGVERKRK